MQNKMESSMNIQLVHSGFIFTSPSDEDGCYKTEVFTSQAKLMKAVRTAIEANSLIAKAKGEDAQGEAV